LLELINERNRNSKTFGPNHPALLSLSKQIAEAQSRLGEAIQTTRATAEAKIADVEQRLTKLNEVKAALDNLEREVNVTSDSLRYYTQKLEESRVTDALAKTKMSNVRVASTPTLAVDPVRPKKLFNLIFALVAGLMASLTLAFFLEYLDHGVKTPEDVDCYLEIPALGSFFRSGRGRMDAQEADRIGTMLDVINADKPLQVIQVTSAVAGEGAQAVARAVAEAYSRELEASTLFVDFTGGATSKKQFSGRPGMSDVLMGQAVLEDVLGAENNLALLGRGTHAEFPMALWTSERFQEFMKEVRSRFTRVVFHVGPVLQAPDALRLAKNVDGVVLVIRAESTRREVVQRASDMVRDAKGKVLGAILTDRKQRIPGIVYRWI